MNSHYYSKRALRVLRNNINIDRLIFDLKIPVKPAEDNYLRFCCPLCQNHHTATDLRTNLARCFDCRKSFNPIDLVILSRDCSFIEAVRFLLPFLSPCSRSFIESQTS